MKRIKFTAIILLLVMVMCLFNGCTNIYYTYNAKMYSQIQDWILPSFLEENKVRGAIYKNPDYVENDYDNPNPASEYYTDETSPEDRVFIIKDQETYNSILKENTLKVDFDKEMVCLYIFADCSPKNKYTIDKISVNDEKISIYYKVKLRWTLKGESTMPYPRCLIVKMKKINSSNVEFIRQERTII